MKFSASLLPAGCSAGFLILVAGLSSCVAQERYDDAQLSAKHYQTKTIESERKLSELQDENRRLRAQLEASDKSVEAGFSPDAFDERLANLKQIMTDVGAQPGDVTKFAVDGGYVYRMKDSIVFALGSAELSAEGKRILGEIAADIGSQPFAKIFVRGHTDDTQISKPETKAKFPYGNVQLSAERAVAVAAGLAAVGKVDEKRLVVMGFGPNEPVAPNTSPENRQKNRRVDIFVTDAAQAAPGDPKQ